MAQKSRRALGSLIFCLVVGCCQSLLICAQITDGEFQKILKGACSFESQDFDTLQRGEIVVNLLKIKEKKQIGVCGIVRLEKMAALSMAVFRESLSQKNNKTVLLRSKFGDPPRLEDLRSLRLEKADLEDLRKCRLGACNVKISLDLSKRIQTDFDWTAADSESQVTEKFRQDILSFVEEYLERGNDALSRYDRRKGDPVEDQRVLVAQTPFVGNIAPEFAVYLNEFPRGELAVTESTLSWSKISFGLRPVITITHNLNYDGGAHRAGLFVVATKQLYASRYINSSLAIAMIVRVTTTDAEQMYLIFTDVSRSDALGGLFSGMKRSIAGSEAISRVTTLLEEARKHLAPPRKKGKIATTEESTGPIDIRQIHNGRLIFWGFCFVAIIFLTYMYRRTRR